MGGVDLYQHHSSCPLDYSLMWVIGDKDDVPEWTLRQYLNTWILCSTWIPQYLNTMRARIQCAAASVNDLSSYSSTSHATSLSHGILRRFLISSSWSFNTWQVILVFCQRKSLKYSGRPDSPKKFTQVTMVHSVSTWVACVKIFVPYWSPW